VDRDRTAKSAMQNTQGARRLGRALRSRWGGDSRCGTCGQSVAGDRRQKQTGAAVTDPDHRYGQWERFGQWGHDEVARYDLSEAELLRALQRWGITRTEFAAMAAAIDRGANASEVVRRRNERLRRADVQRSEDGGWSWGPKRGWRPERE
jgi:hypothetical protein